MPATTLILTPTNVEQGEPSRARRIVQEVKERIQEGRAESQPELGAIASNRSAISTDQPSSPQSIERTQEEEQFRSSVAANRNAQRPHRAPSAMNDVELLQAFQLGDERAFAELYTRRKREVYTFCVRMLAGDRDLASDAFQETFIKVYEKAQSFRSGSNVMGWLYMIARNTCLNLHRAKRPNEQLDDQHMLVSSDRSLAPEFGEEQHYLRQVLEDAIALLPAEFREPFILREFDGFAYGEIAAMTGTSLATTKVRIYRAKQRLRELMRPFLQEEIEMQGSVETEDLSNLIDHKAFGSDRSAEEAWDGEPGEEIDDDV